VIAHASNDDGDGAWVGDGAVGVRGRHVDEVRRGYGRSRRHAKVYTDGETSKLFVFPRSRPQRSQLVSTLLFDLHVRLSRGSVLLTEAYRLEPRIPVVKTEVRSQTNSTVRIHGRTG
jgi:hypothetical protein